MNSRVSWDETWMGVAEAVAKRSRCDGAHIGAVLVDSDQRPVATGYNGPPRTFDDSAGPTCSAWCPRQQKRAKSTFDPVAVVQDRLPPQPVGYGLECPSVHAEANALLFADRRDYAGGTIYITAAICADCAKLVANSGLKRVVMHVRSEDAHRDPNASIRFLWSCGLTVDIV